MRRKARLELKTSGLKGQSPFQGLNPRPQGVSFGRARRACPLLRACPQGLPAGHSSFSLNVSV